MASDPHDELAQRRARRNRDGAAPRPDPDATPHEPTSQEAAIARAREAWILRKLQDSGTPPRDPADNG